MHLKLNSSNKYISINILQKAKVELLMKTLLSSCRKSGRKVATDKYFNSHFFKKFGSLVADAQC